MNKWGSILEMVSQVNKLILISELLNVKQSTRLPFTNQNQVIIKRSQARPVAANLDRRTKQILGRGTELSVEQELKGLAKS